MQQDWKVICVRGDLYQILNKQRKSDTFDQLLRRLLDVKPPVEFQEPVEDEERTRAFG